MRMEKVRITSLSAAVRSFLARVRDGTGVLVEDEQGRARYGVIPYNEATPRQRAAAQERLKRLQSKVGRMMKQTGKTEEEFDRLVQKDR